MIKICVSLCLLLFVFVSFTAASDFPPPTRAPVLSSEKEKVLIKEGIALHDRGDFDGAVKKYEEALATNPDNVEALYELAYSLYSMKSYRRSYEVAMRGAVYKSDLLALLYLEIGNALDDMGQPKESIKAFKAGIKLVPTIALLYYNLGITYDRHQEYGEAIKNLKTSAMLDPKHASSHLRLALVLYNESFKIPAFFAAARFLVLEPRSERSRPALELVNRVLTGGVTKGNEPNHISITVDPNPKKGEGDFSTLELTIGLTRAAAGIGDKKDNSEIEQLVDQMNSMLAILSETDSKKNDSTFSYKYYVPYFLELKKQGMVEPFVYYIYQQSKLEGVSKWLAANDAKVKDFLSWSEHYVWRRELSK